MKITIVITMAGLGTRFRKAGYRVPKYQIMAHGKTLFDWSMISLSGYQAQAIQYIFIVRREDNAGFFLTEHCAALGIQNFKVIELDEMTDGQATTAMLAAPYWNRETALLIYNIDTYVEKGWMNSGELKGDGFIPCFKGEGDHWSFVKTDFTGKAIEVREKVRISDHCTLGAYYFRSCALYEELYHDYYATNGHLEKGEKYVAPLYNHLISQGGEVYISNIEGTAVHVLGTPEELQDFLNIDNFNDLEGITCERK